MFNSNFKAIIVMNIVYNRMARMGLNIDVGEVNENSIRKESRGNEESNGKIYHNTIINIITNNEKKTKGKRKFRKHYKKYSDN